MAATSTPGAAEQILTTNDASLLSDPTWAVLFSGHDLMTFDQLGGANWEIVDAVVGADDRGEPGWQLDVLTRDTDARPVYPAGFDVPNIISVAALDDTDRRAAFSNWGATSVDLGSATPCRLTETPVSDPTEVSISATYEGVTHDVIVTLLPPTGD